MSTQIQLQYTSEMPRTVARTPERRKGLRPIGLWSAMLCIGAIALFAFVGCDEVGSNAVSCGTGDALNSAGQCVAVGTASAVGSSTQFGVNESGPAGLAAIGSTLYMVGSANDWLYTVDTTTGIAMRVGFATQFGTTTTPVNEATPTGLAAIGSTLYMVGWGANMNMPAGRLYTVDAATGVATVVGSATNFDVSEALPIGLTAVGNTLYMIGRGSGLAQAFAPAPKFYTVNAATGVAVAVDDAVTAFGVNALFVDELAAVGDTIYMTGSGASVASPVGQLYTVNTATGRAMVVGSEANFGVGETRPAGLAAIGSVLYMVGQAQAQLYTLALPQ